LKSRYVDLVVADSAAPPWRQNVRMFHAIITDPPYGIREPTEKVGTTRKNPEIPREYLEVHFPQKVKSVSTSV
jgi:tRNA (guanine10-N2)-methyltransferase